MRIEDVVIGMRVKRIHEEYRSMTVGCTDVVTGIGHNTVCLEVFGNGHSVANLEPYKSPLDVSPEVLKPILDSVAHITGSDPNGISQHAPGAKLDAGKVRPSLVFQGMPRALLKVSEVATFGANKYSDGGWLSVPNGISRYTDAQLRHFLAQAKGEEADAESLIDHLAHEAWNALARLELKLREQEKAHADKV